MKEAVILAALFAPLSLLAQPMDVEIFGHVGVVRASEDEGSLGNGLSYGGALTIPFSRRFAIDLDVQSARPERDFGSGAQFRSTQTLVSPGIVYRRGSERLYFFAGGGAGVEHTTWKRSFPMYDAGGTPAGYDVATTESTGFVLNGKAGFVGAVTGRLLIRGDLLLGARYVAPHVGARIGIGFRF